MEVELRTEKCRLCLAENVYIRNEGESNEELQDTICSNCCSQMFDVEEICESESSDNQANETFANGNVDHNVSPVPNEVGLAWIWFVITWNNNLNLNCILNHIYKNACCSNNIFIKYYLLINFYLNIKCHFSLSKFRIHI